MKAESRNPERAVADRSPRILPASRLEAALRPGRALIPYLTASDPTPEAFLEAALGAVEGGAAALEVGVPHSDPAADGPAIQRAHARALAAGGGLFRTLDLVSRLRERSDVPVVLFTYLNPVLAAGFGPFAERARAAGVDGLLALDVPPEEEGGWFRFLHGEGLDPVVLLGPHTSEARAVRILSLGRGFAYVLARAGVTGTHDGTRAGLGARTAAARRLTELPLAVGFGVRTVDDAEEIWSVAEGVVVGSALVERLAGADPRTIRQTARDFVARLAAGAQAPGAADGGGR
jgi:tryptophan synthase alpha chain